MTVVAIVGEVVSIQPGKVCIKDLDTQEEFSCVPKGDDLFDLTIGQTGMFIGEVVRGEIHTRWYHIARLLDPLYEEDVYEAAGGVSLIPLISDPFPSLFGEMVERLRVRRLIEKEREEKAASEAEQKEEQG